MIDIYRAARLDSVGQISFNGIEGGNTRKIVKIASLFYFRIAGKGKNGFFPRRVGVLDCIFVHQTHVVRVIDADFQNGAVDKDPTDRGALVLNHFGRKGGFGIFDLVIFAA